MESVMVMPIWEKYALTVDEASKYFNIGVNKLYKIINEHKSANWLLWNNSKVLIKRKKLEQYLDSIGEI